MTSYEETRKDLIGQFDFHLTKMEMKTIYTRGSKDENNRGQN